MGKHNGKPGYEEGDTWTVWASSGEYQVRGDTVLHALAEWYAGHPDAYVSAITNDLMRPRLVPGEDTCQRIINLLNSGN